MQSAESDKQRALLAIYFHAGILLGSFFNLKMQAIYSFEISVDCQCCYIPENTLLNIYVPFLSGSICYIFRIGFFGPFPSGLLIWNCGFYIYSL
jgi:hypothetical protein